MKTAFLFLLLLPLIGSGQNNRYLPNVDTRAIGNHSILANDTCLPKYSIAKSMTLGFATIMPSHMITISGEKANLHLDFKGDSMVISGDMKMTEAAQKFLDFCKICYKAKIDSMQFKIDSLEYKILHDPWNPKNPIYQAR